MSRYEDLKKKRNSKTQGEKEQEQTTQSRYQKLKANRGARNYGVDDNFINAFIRDAQNFLNSSQNDWKGMSWQSATDKVRSQSRNDTWSDLNSRSSVIRAYLNANKSNLDEDTYNELTSYLDNIKSANNEVYHSFRNAEEYYSQWDTEDAYIKGARENSQERQKRYEENQKKIEALKAQRTQAASGSVYNPDSNFVFPIFDPKVKQIDDEIATLEAENLQYERGEGGYISKTVDDYHKTKQNADFSTGSANREYDNPQKDELTEYDALTDSSTWYYDANDILRDAYGNEIVKDSTGHLVNPKAQGQDYVIKDRLGLFLSATERDIEEYNGTIMSGTWGNIIGEGLDGSWNQLYEDEIDIYYYLLNTSGQETADKYLADMKTELNRRETLDKNAKLYKTYDEANFLEKIALSAATVPAKFVSNIIGTVEDFGNTLKGDDINPYSYAHGGMHFSQTVRGARAEELDATGFKIPLIDFSLGDIYQTGMSRMDSALATSVFGGGGTVFLGMGAAQEEAYRLYQQGASAEQITLDSFAAGAAEAVFEYISFGKLDEIKDVKTLDKLVKSVLIQGWNEATEEALTEVSNIVTNAIIMGGQSDLAEMYKENKENAWNTFLGLVKQTAHSAFGGFIGGTMAGSVQAGRSYDNTQAQYRQTGRTIMGAEGGVDALKNLANEVAGVSDTKMKDALTKQVGKVTDKTTARRVGKLYDTAQTANNLANASANQADIAKSLQRKGFNTETANDIAEALVKSYNGQELTKAQEKLLESAKNSKVVQDAISNIMVNEQSTMGQRSKNIRDFQQDVNDGTFAKKIGVSLDTVKKAKKGIYALEQESSDESSYDVSAEGKTILKSDPSKTINIKRIASIERGKMVFETDDGTVDASDVSYATKDEALVYEAIAKLGGIITADDANRLVQGFSKANGMSAAVYARGVAQAYTYGYYGYSMADAMGENTMSSALTVSQRNAAFAFGRVQRKADAVATQEAREKYRAKYEAEVENGSATKKKGGVYFRTNGMEVSDIDSYLEKAGTVLKDVQKVSIETMKDLSEALGIEFYVFESYVKDGKRYHIDENGVEKEGAPNGWYDKATGKIYIDLHAGVDGRGVMLFTIAHELTHFIHQWSPSKFMKLADIIFTHGEFKGKVAGLVEEKMRKAKERGKPISYEVAYEEVVADAMESILKSGRVIQAVADIKQQDRGAWQAICEWFKNLADKLKRLVDVYQGKDPDSIEGKMAASMKGLIKEIEAIYAEGLVDASKNYQSFMTMAESTEITDVGEGTMFSYSSLAEAAGFTAVENADGTRSFTRDGSKVTEVTVEDIENSPIGAFINYSLDKKDISKADADRQKKMFADICTMACKTNDFAMTMQFVGSAVFTGMKANSDKQYGTTYDFPSICTKTQAVIDAMSAKMVKLGRGLNNDEIVQLYQDVFASGNPVPCPECYVFSRWIGIGGLLDNIKKYQDYYGKMDVADVAKAYLEMKAKVSAFAEEQGITFGKAKGALTSKLTKEYNKLTEKIEKAQNQGERVKPADQKRLEELEPMMNTVKGMTWLENVYFADSSLKKVNPRYRVPDSVLFDLNNGEAFATQYKEAWAFRTTQGAGYGKAITPYAEAKLGEGVLTTNNTTNTIKGKAGGTLDNYFLKQNGTMDKKAKTALDRARLKQKIQAFIGGQRFQSTSDARYENASDYLLAALEMQAMRGMVQVYTKVDGAVPAFSTWGFSINQSLMPLGGGLDADGNVKDTSVGGMNPKVAFDNRNKHESAGTITIGVNDNHIRELFKQWVRDFIIPYHASGGKAEVVAELRRIQEGDAKKGKMVRSTDYSRTQSDKVLSDEVLRWQGKTDAEIERIHQVRDARIAILSGGKPNMDVVRNNRFLSALYDKLNGGEWDGVKLAKGKVESQIFPNEFWDQTVSYDESGKVTRDYLEYCDNLGFLHRFSGMTPSNGKLVPVNGYNQNGERVQLTDLAYKYDENGQKTDEVEEFFWKVLTDRRMYDNEGNYLPQKVVTLNDTTTDTVTGFAKNNAGKEYNKELSDQLVKQITNNRYSIREQFYTEFDAWDGKNPNVSFVVGTTSDALKSIGMKDQEIKMHSGMMINKMNTHPEITKAIFRQVPELLEHPIIVQFSDAIDPATQKPKYDDSITVLGELYAKVMENGKEVEKPVLVAIKLLPTKKNSSVILDFAVVKSAYTKDALQQYLNENSILYIDPDKKRTDSWLSRTRLSLPVGENRYGPIRKIAYVDGKVKVQSPKNMTDMQKKLFDAGIIDEFGNKLNSDRDNAPTFYSQMAKVVDGVKQEKLGAASIVSMLRGKGVKAEEIKWSGIEEWLEGKKSVTKAELQEFIAGSMLQIEEEVLDNKDRPYTEEQQKRLDENTAKRDEIAKQLAGEWKKITGKDFPVRNTGADLESAVVNAIIDANKEHKDASFEGRLLKKLKTDLKEVIDNNDDFGFDSWRDALRSIHRHRRDFIPHYEMSTNDKAVIVKYCNALNAYNELSNLISDADADKLRSIAKAADLFNRIIGNVKSEYYAENAKHMTKWGQYKLKGGDNYQEILFKIPGSFYSNTAMNVHWGERDGVLAHARIQDINTFLGKMLFIEEIQSDWHNEGHKSGYASDEAAILEKIKDLKQQWHSLYTDMLEASGAEARAISEKMDAIDTERASLTKKVRFGDTVPDAPFKDNYHEYVLKRLLREAAEQDYDSIGWTTADVQMDRWNPDRKTNEQMGIEAKNPNAVAFEDGYRIEYDQDIPKFLNKYGKKWGTTVGKTVLDNGTEVWSMAITDSMKDSVLTEGQALYSDRDSDGNQLSAEQQKFFKDSKVRDANGNLLKVFHGTPKKFTTFRQGTAEGWGQGIYFTDNIEAAKEYGENIVEAYLNITNPFNADTMSYYDIDFESTKAYQNFDKKYWQRWYDEYDTYEEYRDDGMGVEIDMIYTEYVDVFNQILRELGYDGIIAYQSNNIDGYEIVAFNENQPKLTSNTNPTSSNDIRYQDRAEESVSNRSLLANAFEGLAQNDIEKNKIQEYRSKVDLINEEERKLNELNAQIKELSFSQGPRDTKKIRDLQFEANQTANRINTYDKQLLRLEASRPLQDVLAREKKKAYQKAEKRGKDALAAYKEKTAKTQRALLEKWQESRKKGIESREKTAMRHKIQSVVGELNQLLLSNDKKRHVPDSLKKAVADALALVNMDTVGAEERAAKYAALITKETDPDKIDAYTVTMENILRQGEKMGQRLKELRDAYEEIQNSDDPDIANAYDPVIAESLKELAGSIGNTSLRDMSVEQLQDVYTMYKMVLTRVRDANKSFIKGRTETISNLASRVVGEVKRVGGEHKYRAAILDFAKKFGWDNMKPVYAFEHIGSGTLTDVFNSVRTGEDVWAVDVTEAREYYLDKSKKYGYDTWDFKKKYSFKSASELDFELTLEQILSLYAYSKREQAHDHLRLGGFVFDSNIETYKEKGSKLIKYKVNTADAHQITPEILANIIGNLTEEQKSFVDEMQEYLSTVMGAKGNEVTMAMYGVKLFKEKFYFPLKSAKQFMFEQNEVSGEVRIKNSGFTNKVVAKANNPVILNNFMDVWANHVNDMSMYHAFVLPLEDFNRVFNYNSPKQEGQPPVSVKGTIQNAYGPSAVGYVRQLITDLNGGAVSDPRESIGKALAARFKKAKVFNSLSVVIQQFSALPRAYALVDPKYFKPTKDGMNHSQLWGELKQYAPVAVIKEMGYFDTNMGKSAQDFIKGKEYSTLKEQAKGFIADDSYRDEVMSKLPAWADEITWCAIWNAVKRETVSTHKDLRPGSEEFLKAAGERFTEVVTKTQVYDSVLARSANMRSKSGLMGMVTSFMAEPTTTANMVWDALIKGKRGDKEYATRAFAAVAVSVLLNNALVALVYAGRDDDEDETLLEKYAQAFASGMLDDINPLTYLPYLKDAWSLFQGYDIERADMSLISDLADASKSLIKAYTAEDGDVVGAWHDLAGTVLNIGGIPADNIRREINGSINFVKNFIADTNGRATTWNSMGDTLLETVKDSTPVWGWLPGDSKSDKLYDAIIKGDKAYENRLKSSYKDDNAYHNAIRKALRENDPRIKEAAIAGYNGDPSERVRIAKLIIADGFAQDDVVVAINAEINAMKPDEKSEPKKKGFYTAEDFAKEIANGDQATANTARTDIIQTAQKNGKSEEEATDSFKSSAKTELKKLYISGGVSDDKVIDALISYCDMDETDAELLVESYDWEVQGYEGATSAAVREYNAHCATASVPKDVYLYIRSFANNTENDKDANGKTIAYSAMKKIMAEINKQYGLTSSQKTAIARSLGWAEKNISKYKTW